MPYNEKLADKIREAIAGTRNLVEKKMFGGIAFMVNDRMCIGVDKDDIMLRCEPDETDELLKKKGARIFDLSGGRPMKGWLLVGPEYGYIGKRPPRSKTRYYPYTAIPSSVGPHLFFSR